MIFVRTEIDMVCVRVVPERNCHAYRYGRDPRCFSCVQQIYSAWIEKGDSLTIFGLALVARQLVIAGVLRARTRWRVWAGTGTMFVLRPAVLIRQSREVATLPPNPMWRPIRGLIKSNAVADFIFPWDRRGAVQRYSYFANPIDCCHCHMSDDKHLITHRSCL